MVSLLAFVFPLEVPNLTRTHMGRTGAQLRRIRRHGRSSDGQRQVRNRDARRRCLPGTWVPECIRLCNSFLRDIP